MELHITTRLKDYNKKNPDKLITKADLADKIGASHATIYNLEKTNDGRYSYVNKICKILGITHEQLQTKTK